MLFRSTSRMAIRPTATSAMIRAYSTRPWPDSSLEKACHSAFILPPWPTASFGLGPTRNGRGLEAGPSSDPLRDRLDHADHAGSVLVGEPCPPGASHMPSSQQSHRDS